MILSEILKLGLVCDSLMPRGVKTGGARGYWPPNVSYNSFSIFYLSISQTLVARPLHFESHFDAPDASLFNQSPVSIVTS